MAGQENSQYRTSTKQPVIQHVLFLQALEYTGRGKTIHDVGLAQAAQPLTTANHYFEMEIIDPGESCYIAIGVAKRVSRILMRVSSCLL